MVKDNPADRDGGMDRLTEAVNEWARSRRSFMGDAAKIGGGALVLSAGIGTAAAEESGGSSASFESMSDLEILNFALLLERLEATFYTEAVGTAPLGEESDDGRVDFDDDNALLELDLRLDLDLDLDDDDEHEIESTYEYFQRIRNHEQEHVDTLAGAIKKAGGTPVQNPGFTFPYDSREEFIGLAQVFEDTGAAAYTSAAPFIDNSAYVGPAAQILSVEARHASYLRSLNAKVPFPRAFQKTLTVAQIKERITPFIDN